MGLTICDNAGTQVRILPEKGATVVSFLRNGIEFLYCNKENLASPERPRCGIPFLFPIFGRLQDGVYQWDGKQYAMEIHGFGHTSVWDVVEHTADTAVLRLTANAETMAVYPFRFQVTLTFRVCQGALEIIQCYENLDETAMPYNFGFHPYFRVDALEHARVETTAQVHFDYSVGKPQPFGHGEVTVSIPQGAPEAGAAFMGVTAPTVLHIPTEGRKITMEYTEDFPQLVLWTQAGKRFLCAEPINGTPNGLNTGEYRTLLPSEQYITTLRICAETI